MAMRLLVALLVSAVTSIPGVRAIGECPAGCRCAYGLELEAECPHGLRLHAQPASYVVVECDAGGALRCDALPSVPAPRASLPSLGVYGCALPAPAAAAAGDSLACALRALGARSLDALTLRDVPAAAAALRPAHLAGLRHLRALSLLRGAAVTPSPLPADALRELPALRRLTVREARLRLEPNAFVDAPPLEYLELSMDRIVTLPNGAFRGLGGLRVLALWGNEITAIEEDSFEGLDALERLDLSSNSLRDLPANVFRHVPLLRTVRLLANPLESVATGAFIGLERLEELVLVDGRAPLRLAAGSLSRLTALASVRVERSGVRALPPDLLAESHALRNFSLAHNRLEALPPPLLRDQEYLEYLDLSNNLITHLTPDLFASLKKLKELNLDRNHIEELQASVFSGLTGRDLTSVSMVGNRLRHVVDGAFHGVSHLRRLSLAGNQLTLRSEVPVPAAAYLEFGPQSPFSALVSLRELDLSDNRIADVFYDWRIVLLQLDTLNLSRNGIVRLDDADVNFLSDSIVVDLRYNNISTISLSDVTSTLLTDEPGSIPNSPSRSARLLLDNNPFECDCRLYAFVRRLSGKVRPVASEPRLEVGDANCSAPDVLIGRRVRTLSPEALACELPAPDCPAACTCALRPAAAALELDCLVAPPLAAYPLPVDYGLTNTTLRLQRAPDNLAALPSHVTSLHLEGIGLTTVPLGPPPPALIELDLADNALTRAPHELLEASGLSLRLAGNPLACDCQHAEDVAALQRFNASVADYERVRCARGEPAWRVDAARLCGTWTAAWAGGAFALLGLVAGALTVLHYRYGRELRVFLYARGICARCLRNADEPDRGERYDAFVSFSHLDEKFVTEHLVPGLERRGFRVCVHYRDWVAGDWIPAQIARSVEQSRRTLVVLSEGFVDSVWGRLEFRAAHVRALRERRARVVVVLPHDPPPPNRLDPELRAYLATNTYVKWGDPWFWDKLGYALPRRRDERVAQLAGDKLARGALDVRLTADGKIINAALPAPVADVAHELPAYVVSQTVPR